MHKILLALSFLPSLASAAPFVADPTNVIYPDKKQGVICPFSVSDPTKCWRYGDANALKGAAIEQRTHSAWFVNVQDPPYSAKCDGTTNDRAAIQAAADSTPSGGRLVIPGACLVSGSAPMLQLLLISQPITVECAGPGAGLLVASTVPSTIDIIRHTGKSEGFRLEGCKVVPVSGTPGRYGLNLDATSTANGTNPISKFVIAGNTIGPFGSAGVATVFPTYTDGVFNGTIRENTVYGGIRLDRAGDTIAIRDNTIMGAGPGVYADLVTGASQLVIEHNSIVSCNGAVVVAHGTRTKIRDNNIEPAPGCAASANNTMVDLQGSNADRIENAEITGNMFSATPSTTHNLARIDYGNGTRMEGNTYALGDAAQRVLLATSHANDVLLGDFALFSYFNDPDTFLIDPATTSTSIVQIWRRLGTMLFNTAPALGKGIGLLGTDSAGTPVTTILFSPEDNYVYLGPRSATATPSGVVITKSGTGGYSNHTYFYASGTTRTAGTTFSGLGTAEGGSSTWCSNCDVATPCTSGGSGAWAFANGTRWACPF